MQADGIEAKLGKMPRQPQGVGVFGKAGDAGQIDAKQTHPNPSIVDEVAELGTDEAMGSGGFGVEIRKVRPSARVIETARGRIEQLRPWTPRSLVDRTCWKVLLPMAGQCERGAARDCER
jgi:hypothetical protein